MSYPEDAVTMECPASADRGSELVESLVLALAQLVRDRWDIEQARTESESPLAFRPRPSNMRTVEQRHDPVQERTA